MRILSCIAVAACLVTSPVFADDCEKEMTTLTISAESEVKAAPDIATISAGVVTVDLKADVALKQNSVKMNEIFAALKAAGVAEKDMQTSGITLNPQYVYEENKSPKITGYQASNSLSVLIRDLKKIGPVLDTLVSKGSNQINGPNFSIENNDELLDKARREAVTKARKRAELYADAAGMKIKRIMQISESSHMSAPMPMMNFRKMEMMAADAGSSTPVAAGQVNMTANVNIVYELK